MTKSAWSWVGILAVALNWSTASAEEWVPKRPIDIVVPSGPGSGGDVFARGIAKILTNDLKVPVRINVLNKAGGSTAISAQYVASKPEDPYTLLIASNSYLTAHFTQQEYTTNIVTDLTTIVKLVEEPSVVVVSPSSPFKTLAEFVEAAKAKPNVMKMAGGSVSALENLTRQMIMAKTGAQWSYISFPTPGERMAALLGGHVDMLILSPNEAWEQIRSGQLRPLAVVASKRLADLPDTPTVQEAGIPIQSIELFRWIMGAPKMPPEAVAYYEKLFEKLSTTPAWLEYLKESRLTPAFANTPETKAFLNKFRGTLKEVIVSSGLPVVR
jgi:putative tricarboxylic transport membrane protein